MTEVADLYVLLRANTSSFSASMKGAAAEGERFTATVTRGTRQLAAFGVLGAAALVGVGIKSLDMAAHFQAATERIRTQAGASQAEVEKVRASILGMGGKTAQGPMALAEAFYHVESAGYRAREATDLVRAAFNLADVSGANLEDTTNGLVGILQSGWVRGAGAAARATELMNAIVGAGNMKMQDLNGALSTGIAAASSTFGVSMQSAGAALALMTDMAVPAQQAATHLRMTLSLLAAPSKQAAKYLHDVGLTSADAGKRISATQQILQKAGVTTTQISNDLRKPDGLLVALQDLKTHMVKAGLTANEQGALISRAFGGGKSGAAIMEMYGRLDLLKQKYEQIGSGVKNFGADVKATHQTLSFQLGALHGRLSSLMTALGLRLIPIATKALGALNKALDWLGKHRQVAIALGGALAGVLAVGLTMAAVAAWEFLSPFLLIAAPIAAVAGGLVYLYEKSKTFHHIVNVVAHGLRSGLGAAMQWITHTALPALHRGWTVVWHAIGAVVQWFINGPVKWVRKQLEVFHAFWKAHGDSIVAVAKKVWALISNTIMTDVRVFMDFLRPELTTLHSLWTLTWHLVWNAVKTVFMLIRDTIQTGVKVILDIIGLFADLLHGKWGRLWDDAKKLVGDAIDGINTIVGDFAKNALHLLWQAGKDLIQGLINGIKSMAGGAVGAVKDVGKGLIHGVTSLLGIHSPSTVFFEFGKNIVDGLTLGMHAHMSKAERHAHALAHRVIAAHRKGIAEKLREQGAVLSAESHHETALGKMLRHPHSTRAAAQMFARDFAEALRNDRAAHALLRRVLHDPLSTGPEQRHAAAEVARADRLLARLGHLRVLDQRRTLGLALTRQGHALTGEAQHISALSAFLHGPHDQRAAATMFAKDFAEALRNDNAAHQLLARVLHSPVATAAMKHRAEAEATRADKLLARFHGKHGLDRFLTDHPAHAAAQHARRVSAHQAILRELPSYLALTRAHGLHGVGGLSTFTFGGHGGVSGSVTSRGGSYGGGSIGGAALASSGSVIIVPAPVVNVKVLMDNKAIAHEVVIEASTKALRHERRNVNNGLSRYTRR